MSEWAAKRFWTEVTTDAADGGFAVFLDGRQVMTPGKAPLILPTRALAQAVAAEWEAQDKLINPQTMPYTRSANSAIDKVAPQKDEVVSIVAAYGETDLLCYRATGPEGLITRQVEGWTPLLAWAEQALGAPLAVTSGVLPVDQPGPSLARLRARVEVLDAFALTALHDLVALSGSLIIGLKVLDTPDRAEELWALSRIDETWQAEQWGEDEEAAETADSKRRDFLQAVALHARLTHE